MLVFKKWNVLIYIISKEDSTSLASRSHIKKVLSIQLSLIHRLLFAILRDLGGLSGSRGCTPFMIVGKVVAIVA